MNIEQIALANRSHILHATKHIFRCKHTNLLEIIRIWPYFLHYLFFLCSCFSFIFANPFTCSLLFKFIEWIKKKKTYYLNENSFKGSRDQGLNARKTRFVFLEKKKSFYFWLHNFGNESFKSKFDMSLSFGFSHNFGDQLKLM